MSIKRLLAAACIGASLLLTAVASPPASATASTVTSTSSTSLPQISAAEQASTWLAGQFGSEPYIPLASDLSQPDLSATANAVLALASAGDLHQARVGLYFLAFNFENYVTVDGADGPGQLALIMLDAHALGLPAGDLALLAARLENTQQTSGSDAGLFGTELQLSDYSVGNYTQGLALAALAAVGVTSSSVVTSAESWLTKQQCSDGGWTTPDNSLNPCSGSPASFQGPDTNATALAIEGLAAQGVLGGTVETNAVRFLHHSQDSNGGWGYEPNTAGSPGTTDPDSTALVIQAILAMGKSPTLDFSKNGVSPVTALASFQLTAGSGLGAFTYPGANGPNLLATYQAIPALAGDSLPFNLAVSTSTLPAGTVGTRYAAGLASSGGQAPYAWSVVEGSLPAGLELTKAGVIKGTPTVAGTSIFTVAVTSKPTFGSVSSAQSAWATLSLTIG